MNTSTSPRASPAYTAPASASTSSTSYPISSKIRLAIFVGGTVLVQDGTPNFTTLSSSFESVYASVAASFSDAPQPLTIIANNTNITELNNIFFNYIPSFPFVFTKPCVILSNTMANTTIARPAANPNPTFTVEILSVIIAPRPGAPIIDATTAIDNDNIIVGVIPDIIVGSANGSCTLKSNCHKVEPNECDASTISPGTCLIPRLVILIAGGAANTNVAITAGTPPRPNNKTAGIR